LSAAFPEDEELLLEEVLELEEVLVFEEPLEFEELLEELALLEALLLELDELPTGTWLPPQAAKIKHPNRAHPINDPILHRRIFSPVAFLNDPELYYFFKSCRVRPFLAAHIYNCFWIPVPDWYTRPTWHKTVCTSKNTRSMVWRAYGLSISQQNQCKCRDR